MLSIYHLLSRISIHLQRYFIKIRAAVHYFVQQTLSFAESSGTFSAGFSFGWQCPENRNGPADAGAGCTWTASRPDRLTPVYRGASADFSRKHRKRRFWPQLAGNLILLAGTENSANGIRWLILAIGSKWKMRRSSFPWKNDLRIFLKWRPRCDSNTRPSA